MNPTDPIFVSSFSTFLIIALAYWFMPYATPKTVVFGVRIPPSRKSDQQILELRRKYHTILLTGSIAISLLTIIIPAYLGLLTLTFASFIAEIIFAFLNYYRTNRKLEHIKTDQGWYDNLKQAVGSIYEKDDLKESKLGVFLTMVPSIAIIIVTIYIGITAYPGLPNPIPTHFGADGQPNGFSPKSIGTAFLIVFVQIGITAMMFGIGYAIVRTRQEIDVTSPIETLIQQERFKNYTRTSLYLFQALINMTLMFTSFNIWNVVNGRYILPFTIVPVLAGAAVLVVVMMSMGQMGSRLNVGVTEPTTGVVNRNDDSNWIAGSIYYNRNDSSILVGKRFGVGWTFNFARPVTWIIMGAIIGGTILAILIPVLIATHHI